MQDQPKNTTRNKPKLLDQVRAAIQKKHYSIRTEESYISWIKRFVKYHGLRHPGEMGEAEIQQFLNHLAVKEKVAASTQNQALCAIIFLYTQVLKQEVGTIENIVWAKKPKKLPVVFTRKEAQAVLNQLSGMNWLTNLFYKKRSNKQSEKPGLPNRLPVIPSGTHLQPIYWKPAMISERSRNYWGIHPVR